MTQPEFSLKYLVLRPMVKRFIGGETLPEALETLRELRKKGFFTTLDLLGESVSNKKEALKATEEYIENLKVLKQHNLDRNISIKLTQLGLDVDYDFAKENLVHLAKVAGDMNGFVRVDMEGSAYTEMTIKLVDEVHREYPHVGTVLQASLRRTSQDAVQLLKSGVKIRLCKGAYKEPPSIAFADKPLVDQQYITVMKRLLTSGIYHGIATHDGKIIEEAKQFACQQKIKPDSFEFQMLLGIRNKFAEKLVKEGWRVRIYVPYGTFWFPYMTRRLRERKENLWFVVKNLFQD